MNEKNLFLNGRQQIIDMLKLLSPAEREKLLSKVRLRSPQLADSLSANATTFHDLFNVSDYHLAPLFNSTDPRIVGLALKRIEPDIQRRVLKMMSRDKAEQAFKILNTQFNDQEKAIQKAQNKILTSFNPVN
jgi:flagellar motor switch protein FliG